LYLHEERLKKKYRLKRNKRSNTNFTFKFHWTFVDMSSYKWNLAFIERKTGKKLFTYVTSELLIYNNLVLFGKILCKRLIVNQLLQMKAHRVIFFLVLCLGPYMVSERPPDNGNNTSNNSR